MSIRLIGIMGGLVVALVLSVTAGDGAALRTAMNRLYDLPLDTAATFDVQNLIISHEDMMLHIDSGRLAFYSPVMIDSVSHTCCAYLEGKIRFAFSPSPDWEIGQLQRFYKSNSVLFDAKEIVLFFTGAIRTQLASQAKPAAVPFTASAFKKGKKLVDRLQEYDAGRRLRFEILHALLNPSDRPFLLLSVESTIDDRMFYKFNPHDREEVEFYKNFRQPGSDFMELVCEYSQYTLKPEIGVNGLNKERLRITNYVIDGQITTGGNYVGSARMTAQFDSSLRVIDFGLHNDLEVDSVHDASGKAVTFGRYKKDNYWYYPLYLFFDTLLPPGSSTDLTVYCKGKIARRELGEFFVNAGAAWYPHYGFRIGATFDMSFKTSKRFAFVATGEKTDERIVAETLFTHWKVAEPAPDVSFAIGNMKKYEFSDTAAGPVDVYYSEELHRNFADELAQNLESIGSHMERQVSEDIINALRVFQSRFGDYPYPRTSVTEILALHGQAYPGFLHMGIPTWMSTDEWGNERVFRSHEVAHQWWGVGVGYETYHDQWLSEGFSEYSALMYLQAVSGNDKFLDKVRDYRKDIIGANHFLFGSGAESGPIVLGYRTTSTKTRGDYGLIIYKKGALVLHMLRNMMMDLRTFNEDRFFAMMKEYYETYRGKNATTADFRAIVEKHVGEDMGWFFDEWIYGTDIPTIDFTYTVEPGENSTFVAKCKMVTKDVSEDFVTYIPVEIQIDDKNKAYIRVVLDKPVTEFTLPGLPRKPKALKLNPFESVLADINQ